MLLKKQFPNMERTLVLLAILDFSRLVFANQGEPGSSAWEGPQSLQLFQSSETPGLPPASSKIVNPVGSTEMKLATSPALSGTANLMQTPISLKSESGSMSGRTENLVKITEMKLTAVPAFSGTASEPSTPDTPTLSTDVVKESVTTERGSLNAIQTPNFSVLLSSLRTHSLPSPVQSLSSVLASVVESVMSTSLPPVTVIESVPHSLLISVPFTTLVNVTARASVSEHDAFLSSSQVLITSVLISPMQSHLSQSPIQLSSSVLTSAVEGVTSTSLPPVTVFASVPHSSSTSIAPTLVTNITASANMSEYDAFLSSSLVQQSSIIPNVTSQNRLSQVMSSARFSQFTSTVQVESSSLHLSTNQSLEVVAMTTKAPLSSDTHVAPLLSTSNTVALSTPTSLTSSGSTRYGSSLLMSSSVAVPEFNASSSREGIHPTTVYLPMEQSSLLPSSSAFMPPPTTASPGNPGPPVIQDVTVQSASTVLLQWNATNTQFISNFSVEFSTNSISWNRALCQHSLAEGACIVAQTEATVTVLKAYTNYTFRVAAQGPFGKSNYSTESEWALTSEAAPSGSPRITTAYNLSSHEIYVAWQPPSPETLNGKLRMYQIRIREVGTQLTTSPTISPVTGDIVSSVASSSSLSPGTFVPVPTTPSDAGFPVSENQEPNTEEERREPQVGEAVVIDAGLNVSYHIGQLKKWMAYEVEVRAVTVAPGPFSNKVIVWTDEDVPSRPTGVKAIAVNSTAISVNWTEPAEVNGVIVKYEVRYVKRNSSKPAVTRSVQETMSVVLSSLNPFTVYEISISAFSSKGEGNRTTVQEQTDEGQPSAPQNISTESLNSTAILASWEKPAHPNGKIKYRLFLRKESDPVAFFWLIYDGESIQYVVSNLKPFTQYSFKVKAYNVKYNLSSSSIVATETTAQAAPSGPPQNLRAIANSSSSIILYWMPPKAAEQNGQITSYNVHISGALELNTSATVFAVTGLQAYTNYSFMVQAVNAGGTGPYSSVITNRTFEAEPSSPRNLTAKSVNSTAIKVAWVQALHPNGIIRYKLNMRLSKDGESMNQLVYEGLGTSYVVAGLQEYVMYTFTVVSLNIKYGWTSKQAVAKETTHPAEPTGPPQNVAASTLSSSSIHVTWDPPPLSERNGLITHYTVQYTSRYGQSRSVNTTDNRTSIVVEDLSVFTTYSFSVKAWNVVGAGPDSKPVTNTTWEDRPSPPTSVAVKTVNSTAIKVTWRAPLQPNGEISYRLYFWQSSQGFETSKLAYDGMLLEYTVADLHEYVTYTFMIQAYNVKYSWRSTGMNVSETTHPAAPAGPPQDVMALTQSPTSILITWSPPLALDRNGIITRYIVKYNLSSDVEANISTLDNSTQIVVTNLKKYSSYYFTVQAENKIGVGPSSVAVVNTTLEDVPGVPIIEGVNNAKIDSLEVMWKHPVETNGVIKAYELCWSLANLQNLTCAVLSGATRSHVIAKLKPYTQYRISLNATTSAGFGQAAIEVSRTAEGVPSRPRDLRAWNTSEYSIFVTWKTPLNVNGKLQGYKVFYEVASSTGLASVKDVGLDNKTTLSGLTAYTTYKITVQAFTGAGGGTSDSVYVMTEETAPSSDVTLWIRGRTKSSIELSWLSPTTLNGKIGYYLHYRTTTAVPAAGDSFVLPGHVHKKVLSNLKPYTEYRFSIVAYNLKRNLSARAISISATTLAAAPKDPPRNVVINRTTSNSITLSWDPPLEPNGVIEGYDVRYYERESPNKLNIDDNVKRRVHTISDLEPWRYYRILVACQSSGGLGPYSESVEQRTDPGAPPPLDPLEPPGKDSIQSYSFSIKLTKASNEKGIVSFYQVIVIELATDNTNEPVPAQDPDTFKAEDLYTYDQARKMKPQLVPYIAAQFRASEFNQYKLFVVGGGDTSSDATDATSRRRRRRQTDSGSAFFNGPLEENTYYAVFQRAYVNKDVYSSSEWMEPVATAAVVTPTQPGSSTHIGLIVGLILVIVIIAVLILVGFFIIRRKRSNFGRPLDDRDDYTNGQPVRMKKLSRKRKSLQKRLMGSTESLPGLDDLAARRERRQPVPIDDFERHVDRMHMDGDHGFSEEYALVQPDDEFSFQQFLNPANKYKNRYANIVAYDHTRVLLNPIEGVPGSDYINANFIDGYNRQRAYVAAQGPLMETFDDFWRMMWEQMSTVIVMLTKLEERGRRKCDQYWPERGTKSYGPIQVTLKETLNMSHYTVRKFIMTHKKYPDDDRVVRQFHFTAWPDHGVPSHPTPLLSLVRHTSSANRESVGPMVVHCSAGVGRTGTFVTLDVMLQRISQEDSVDVFGFVRQMRYQRNFMVQTEAQYVFIHDALLEAITCGVTEVEAKDLSSRIRELRQFDPETGYTYLENEFCRLAKEENHPIAFKSASLNCNTAKNRYANILPFESTRVHLKMRPGEMGSDYINANFIDGYCQPRAYIATQAPIPDTFEDFWRLVWEQESATIVMLTREEEAGKVKCHHYWSSEGSRLYGVILVELIEEASFGDYISRKFKLTHTEEKVSRTVSQFQYTDWPDTGTPDSGVGIVDLIGQVQKWQQQSGNTVIVIHCSGGVGRTGVFCGISMMIERVKSEGVIDVFQTVQAMRLQRPAMVQTAEQYEFCYTTLQEYLDSFDLYANFQ